MYGLKFKVNTTLSWLFNYVNWLNFKYAPLCGDLNKIHMQIANFSIGALSFLESTIATNVTWNTNCDEPIHQRANTPVSNKNRDTTFLGQWKHAADVGFKGNVTLKFLLFIFFALCSNLVPISVDDLEQSCGIVRHRPGRFPKAKATNWIEGCSSSGYWISEGNNNDIFPSRRSGFIQSRPKFWKMF